MLASSDAAVVFPTQCLRISFLINQSVYVGVTLGTGILTYWCTDVFLYTGVYCVCWCPDVFCTLVKSIAQE